MWSGAWPRKTARALLIAGCATLFLNAAATFEAVYTFRVPYLLLASAVVVGAPLVVRGWRCAPYWVRWGAFALVVVYLVATATGSQHVLRFGRAGGHRNLVYLADLGVGLCTVGLILGLQRSPLGRWDTIVAVALGAFVVGVYGVYQWFALHDGLPLAHVNNTLDTNGITFGAAQGPGLLGWDRINGTFPEPHSLATYLAACMPLSVVVTTRLTGHLRTAAIIGVAAIGVALALTVTVPAWASLAAGATLGAVVYAVGRGLSGPAAVAGACLVLGCFAVPVIAAEPSALEAVTNRSSAALEKTTHFRTETWRRVTTIWAQRPILGFGAGQSSVRLAELEIADGEPTHALASAQGIWAASLVDAGVLGFGAWALFFVAALGAGGASLVRRPEPVGLAAFVAMTVAILTGLIGDDRLALASWVLIGIALTSAVRPPAEAYGAAGDR
jgi:hypothetical protein